MSIAKWCHVMATTTKLNINWLAVFDDLVPASAVHEIALVGLWADEPEVTVDYHDFLNRKS